MSGTRTRGIGVGEGWGFGRPVNIQGTDDWSVSSYQSRVSGQRIRRSLTRKGFVFGSFVSSFSRVQRRVRWGVKASRPLYIYSPTQDHTMDHMRYHMLLFTTIY